MDINIEYPPLIQKRFNLPGHSFVLGNLLRVSGDNAFAPAQANSLANSRAIGVVRHINGDVVSICLQGFISDSAIVPNLPANTLLYVSASVAGAFTDTAPSSNDNAVAVIVEAGVSMFYMGTIRNYGSGGSSLPPVNGSYADQAAMIAAQGSQIAQYIYFDGTDYWEYLGTTNGDITDYRNIGGAFWPLAGTGTGPKANGTIDVDPAFVGDLILQDSGASGKVRLLTTFGVTTRLEYESLAGDKAGVIAGMIGFGASAMLAATSASTFQTSSFNCGTNTFSDATTYPVVNAVNNKRWNFNGVAAPTVNDDNTLGYGVDSGFIHDGTLYICTDDTTGAAVWIAQGGSGQSILPITRSALQTLLTGGTADPNQIYRVTDAVSSSIVVDVFLLDASTLASAIDQTNNYFGFYNITGDNFINLDNVGVDWIAVTTSLTAVNKRIYGVTANATFTDPTGVSGLGYTVIVRGGTAIVGGVSYSTAGTIIQRVYNGSTWASYATSPGLRMSRVLTGDFSTTSDTFTDVTALEMTLEANKNYSFRFTGRAGCDNSGGSRFGFTLPSGAAMNGYFIGRSSGASAMTNQGLAFPASSESGLVTNQTGGSSFGGFSYEGTIIMGGTAGAVTPRWRSNTNTQESTLYAGFIFKIEEE
jgi:hypothetical protein